MTDHTGRANLEEDELYAVALDFEMLRSDTVTPPQPSIGSLCSGYGGLDLGVRAVFGGTVAWHAEVDPGPARILSRHWPTVPNLGDITAANWADAPEVCILTAGFPCQRRLGRRSSRRTG